MVQLHVLVECHFHLLFMMIDILTVMAIFILHRVDPKIKGCWTNPIVICTQCSLNFQNFLNTPNMRFTINGELKTVMNFVANCSRHNSITESESDSTKRVCIAEIFRHVPGNFCQIDALDMLKPMCLCFC